MRHQQALNSGVEPNIHNLQHTHNNLDQEQVAELLGLHRATEHNMSEDQGCIPNKHEDLWGSADGGSPHMSLVG